MPDSWVQVVSDNPIYDPETRRLSIDTPAVQDFYTYLQSLFEVVSYPQVQTFAATYGTWRAGLATGRLGMHMNGYWQAGAVAPWEQREKRENGEWVKDEPYVSYIITTSDESLIAARTVWLILHKRWDIESAFNDLKNNWAFSYCCCRHPNAIKTVYLLFMNAYNLLALFHRNHLWWDKDLHRTTLSKLLLIGLLSITKPWRPRTHGRQPIRYLGNLAYLLPNLDKIG